MEATSRRRGVLALGVWLSWREPLVVVALAIAAIEAIAGAAFGLEAPASTGVHLPALAAMAIAWSAGVMLAVGGALGAIPRDGQRGVIALVRMRGVPLMTYAFGRTLGLAVLVGIGVCGATLVTAICVVARSPSGSPALRASAGAVAYAAAFSVALSAIAMAALGARSRATGYLSFLAVLAIPEAVASSTGALLPDGWHELTSIPAALDAIRVGIEAPGAGGVHMARAAIGLAAIVAASMLVVRARVPAERTT